MIAGLIKCCFPSEERCFSHRKDASLNQDNYDGFKTGSNTVNAEEEHSKDLSSSIDKTDESPNKKQEERKKCKINKEPYKLSSLTFEDKKYDDYFNEQSLSFKPTKSKNEDVLSNDIVNIPKGANVSNKILKAKSKLESSIVR